MWISPLFLFIRIRLYLPQNFIVGRFRFTLHSPTSPRYRGLPHIERPAEPRTTNRSQVNPATVCCFPKIIVQGIYACKRTILFVDPTKIGTLANSYLDALRVDACHLRRKGGKGLLFAAVSCHIGRKRTEH